LSDAESEQQEKSWIDMWRCQWPEEKAIDPHDPESFGFAYVGEITGSHGIQGDVRVRVDDFLMEQGFDPAEHLSRRNYSNWTEKKKRVHLKAPHRRFPRPFNIITGKKVQSRVYALRLNGIESIDEAMSMRGYKIYTLSPPPGVIGDAPNNGDFSGVDLYDADTTTFHTHDALELIGAKCLMIQGEATEEELGEFASAPTPESAEAVLNNAGLDAVHFGALTAVVPDYKISRRHRSRKAAHDLLDITLVPEINAGKGKYLYEPDPNSTLGRYLGNGGLPSEYEQVCYVPFVPDMIARVDADRSGTTVYFTLPKGHIEATSFTCRKRIVNEQGLLAIPRGATARALLPPAGKSHALRRRNKSRPLHGTAPAPPPDMPMPAGTPFPDPKPGVPRPPVF